MSAPQQAEDTGSSALKSTTSQPVVIVIVGPQASGKSALAHALAERLRRCGDRVARVELDAVAAMALPTLPSWELAHAIFTSVVVGWVDSGDFDCVIAEGSGSAAEVAQLVDAMPATAATVTVATTTRLDVAFDRASADPTRGVSRQYDFLSRIYREWSAELAAIPADLVVDTSELDVDTAAARVAEVIELA